MISIAKAPAKVILFGEHFVVHRIGSILCAIDMKVKITAETLDDKSLVIDSKIGSCNVDISDNDIADQFRWLKYIVQDVSEKFDHKGGMRIKIESDIPPKAGLGSSSACCIAATHAITGLFSKYSKEEIVELALRAEKTMFANASGADSTASAYGGILHFDMKSGFQKLQSPTKLNLLVADSGMQRNTADIVDSVSEFRANNTEEFVRLCKSESSLLLKAQQAIKDGNLKDIGACMRENQSYLQRIGVSNDTLDSMIKIADEYGYGSKITGAGGGGCIVSVVHTDVQDNVIDAFSKQGYNAYVVRMDSMGTHIVSNS